MKNKIFNGFEIVHDLIKLRWVPEILKSISQGNRRYSEILNSIPYMSHTELNRKLAILGEKKVIEKREEDGSYLLLEFGKDLVHIFHHLEDLEEKYFQIRDSV
ncbi:MAG: helix-turn-helix transcriptional regulator [Tissierellia bacterium]|nr:helix-turn-helix transcriptional regulator [Tissierellia bacterium]